MNREERGLEDLHKVHLDKGKPLEKWLWQIKGSMTIHHPTQPAIQYKNGDWTWYWMDKLHRWDGPAVFQDGEYEYWIMGERLSRGKWERHPLRIKWLRNQMERI